MLLPLWTLLYSQWFTFLQLLVEAGFLNEPSILARKKRIQADPSGTSLNPSLISSWTNFQLEKYCSAGGIDFEGPQCQKLVCLHSVRATKSKHTFSSLDNTKISKKVGSTASSNSSWKFYRGVLEASIGPKKDSSSRISSILPLWFVLSPTDQTPLNISTLLEIN